MGDGSTYQGVLGEGATCQRVLGEGQGVLNAGGSAVFKICSSHVPQVTSQEGKWWNGTLNGQSGIFPCNYVQPHTVEPPCQPVTAAVPPSTTVPPSPSPSLTSLASDASVASNQKPLVARVTKPYEATKEKELSLKSGQYIKVECTRCLFTFIVLFYLFYSFNLLCCFTASFNLS